MVARIAYHDVPGRGKFHFRFARNRRIQRRKYQLWTRSRLQRFHRKSRRVLRQFRRQTPGQIAVTFTRRTLACCQPRNAKPWMISEQRDELLPHGSRRAQNSHINFRGLRPRRPRVRRCLDSRCLSGHWPQPPSVSFADDRATSSLRANLRRDLSRFRSRATSGSANQKDPVPHAFPRGSTRAS